MAVKLSSQDLGQGVDIWWVEHGQMIAGHFDQNAIGGEVTPFELKIAEAATGTLGGPEVKNATGPGLWRPGAERIEENAGIEHGPEAAGCCAVDYARAGPGYSREKMLNPLGEAPGANAMDRA